MPPIFRFEVDGEPVELMDLTNPIRRAGLDSWRAAIENSLGERVCSVHKIPPTILLKIVDDFPIEIHLAPGCCPDFEKEVRRKLPFAHQK